jgi:hypothetical protein
MSVEFQRFDTGKLRWSLLPRDVMRDIVEVLEFGASKYAVDNWKLATSQENIERCWNSFDRHRDALQLENQYLDTETGLAHTAHMLCNLVFIHWHLKEKLKYEKETHNGTSKA